MLVPKFAGITNDEYVFDVALWEQDGCRAKQLCT